jgi:hypothetical protein
MPQGMEVGVFRAVRTFDRVEDAGGVQVDGTGDPSCNEFVSAISCPSLCTLHSQLSGLDFVNRPRKIRNEGKPKGQEFGGYPWICTFPHLPSEENRNFPRKPAYRGT